MGEPAGVDIKTLSAAQLSVLGEQLEEELGTLSESFGKLQSAVTRFFQSGTVLEALAEEKAGALACAARGGGGGGDSRTRGRQRARRGARAHPGPPALTRLCMCRHRACPAQARQ